jgi:hypothetical protein
VAPIFGRQIDAVGLVIRRDDYTADIEDVVLAQVLLIDLQHFGRRCREHLHFFIEIETANVSEIVRLAHPQDHRFDVAVKPTGDVFR